LVVVNPEKILFKIKENNLDLKDLSQDTTEISLKFQNHDISTTLKELLAASNWDDIYDFKQKVIRKEIKIDEILILQLKSMNEILKSIGAVDGLVECCICFGIGKKDTYIFQSCSHFICKKCLLEYVTSKGLSLTKKNQKGNLLEIFFADNKSLPCPKCKQENKNPASFLKIYI